MIRAPLIKGMPANQFISLLAVCRTTNTGTGLFIAALGSESGGSGNTVFGLKTGTVANRIGALVGGATGHALDFESSAVSLNDGKWHAVMVVADLSGSATRVKIYADGVLVASSLTNAAAGTLTYTSVCAGGFRRGATDSPSFIGDVLLAQPFVGRILSDAEGCYLTKNYLSLFQPEESDIYIPVGGSTITLTGAEATTTPAADTGTITQTHSLTGAAATATASADTGAVSQTHILAGAESAATPAADTGAIVQTHTLAGATATTTPAADAGAIFQTHVLAGAEASATPTANTGEITTGALVMVGSPATATPTANTGAITQTHILAGAAAAATPTATTGAISTGVGIGTIRNPALYRATPTRRIVRSTPTYALWRAA